MEDEAIVISSDEECRRTYRRVWKTPVHDDVREGARGAEDAAVRGVPLPPPGSPTPLKSEGHASSACGVSERWASPTTWSASEEEEAAAPDVSNQFPSQGVGGSREYCPFAPDPTPVATVRTEDRERAASPPHIIIICRISDSYSL